MNPLEALAKSSTKITPSLLEYEVGTDVEVFLYQYLDLVKDEYENIIIISFFDAHRALFDYLKRVFSEYGDALKRSILIPVYSKVENERIEGAPPVIIGEIGRKLRSYSKKSLVLIIGLDFYSIMFGEESLAQLYPRMANLRNYNQNLDVLITLNTKLFSDRTVQIINGFSLNIVRLGVEGEKEPKRYILIVRSVFLEFNLNKWYYKINEGKIQFYNPIKPS